MEPICSSEISVDFQRTTQYYIPKDSTLHDNHDEIQIEKENIFSDYRNEVFLTVTEKNCVTKTSLEEKIILWTYREHWKWNLFKQGSMYCERLCHHDAACVLISLCLH
jgi:hypothetical protein